MLIRQIEDDSLAQYGYLLGCQQTGEALIVDPERDVDRYLALADRHGLRAVAAAETHIHADFLSGVRELAARRPDLRVYLSDAGDAEWKYRWPAVDRVDAVFLRDGDVFSVGRLELRTWHTPGHTPEHLAFFVTDKGGGATAPMGVISGDFVFVGDLGRPDLLESAAGVAGMMEPSARRLFGSARAFLELPDFLQVWPGHGAGSACGRALGAVPVTTVGYERRFSPALAASEGGEDAFVRYILAEQPDPPLYFARMKQLNKNGPPLAGRLLRPPRLSAAELAVRAARPDVQLVDTVGERRTYLAGHVPGALFAPLDRTFPTVVGSLVNPDLPMVLLVDEAQLDAATRQLVRIGYDRVDGWCPRPSPEAMREAGLEPEAIRSIEFQELEARQARTPLTVLDVRGAAEHDVQRLEGSLNIPHTRVRSRVDEVPSGRPIYVHCASGARAAVAAAFLAHAGRAVVHVDGGLAADHPSVTR